MWRSVDYDQCNKSTQNSEHKGPNLRVVLIWDDGRSLKMSQFSNTNVVLNEWVNSYLLLHRYSSPTMESNVQYYIQDVVKEQLTKRQMIDGVSRNMLRFLASVCGYSEVRLIASQKIEAWLQNPKVNSSFLEKSLRVRSFGIFTQWDSGDVWGP